MNAGFIPQKGKMDNKLERYLILKMADLVTLYKEPYDSMDIKTEEENKPLKNEYEIYKKMLKELCNF